MKKIDYSLGVNKVENNEEDKIDIIIEVIMILTYIVMAIYLSIYLNACPNKTMESIDDWIVCSRGIINTGIIALCGFVICAVIEKIGRRK
ncbi:MAG: hypothetical protein J7K95_02265 [Thermoplasmata archaeon]|nr:hypothetical protein [Thermoplasmata archaeon]